MSVFNQIKCELDAPEPAAQINLSREVAVEVCLRYDRLRAIVAELLAALEWIAEDGGVCARAAECARAAIEKDASS